MKMAICALVLALAALLYAARADEMSGDDKLRILYSHGFVFTNGGLPLLTVELMDEQREVQLANAGGLSVLPDGEGGPEVVAGKSWKVTVESPKPARMRFWTVVSRQAADP